MSAATTKVPFGYLDRAGREAAEARLKSLWLDGTISTADHCLLHRALMCLDDLMCEFVERPALPGWQPIETAPKDGTSIYLPVSTAVRAYWCKDLNRWITDREWRMNHINDPKQWRPTGTALDKLQSATADAGAAQAPERK